MYSFPNSSAIDNISNISDNKVTITWKKGPSYTYNISDVQAFTSALSKVIISNSSVGRFVNQQIQENSLQLV